MKEKSKSAKEQLDLPLFANLDSNAVKPMESIEPEKAEQQVFEALKFDDPDRPLSCLEVDFPIFHVSEIAAHESSGPCTKPIYKMSKWWARRRSTVFRQLLISAATKAPSDQNKSAQYSWNLMYRRNHQKHEKFKGLKVLDVFMGGGTTVVEAARLGFDVYGVDLNPIAWWIVRNETTPTPAKRIEEFKEYLKEKYDQKLSRFFNAKSPRGYEGSKCQVVYTFWMKHIMCSDPSCNHLTPQVATPVIAEKSLSLGYYADCVCPKCGDVFDLELGDARLAPKAKFVVSESEKPFSFVDTKGKSKCPHCKQTLPLEWVSEQERKKSEKKKKVELSLLLPKAWLQGVTATNKNEFGGFWGASLEAQKKWFEARSVGLELIEVRGEIPEKLLRTNYAPKPGTQPRIGDKSSGKLVCGKCGRVEDPLKCIKLSGHQAAVFPYAIHGIDPDAKKARQPYNGRFFDVPDYTQILSAEAEYQSLDSEVLKWAPAQELFYGYKTHHWAIPDHGYTHWYKMFIPRQLLVLTTLLNEIMAASQFSKNEKSQMLGAFQNYIRHNCCFTLWNIQADQLEPHFMNNNYHPKATFVENGVFSDLGRGNFASCIDAVIEGMNFAVKPFDIVKSTTGGKTEKIESKDKILSENVKLICGSSTDLKRHFADASIDMVITDPPFGDNINYAELADFFLVWLHAPLNQLFPEIFQGAESPKTLEAVTNKARHPGVDENGNSKADAMYDRLLSLCWKESARVLKPGGLLAFTFHHDDDTAWINVLESLFRAGFIIESTFPVRSDAKRGEGHVGAQKIEFDIVHVCRKRATAPPEIYWATLRRQILESVKNMAVILAQHRLSGLHLADLEVIIRGEVLQQYSRYYGNVKKNLAGDQMTVREILVEANSIAVSLLQTHSEDRVPENLEPSTRVFLNLLREGPTIEKNAALKRAKGSGLTVDDFVSNGWLSSLTRDGQKFYKMVDPIERWNSLARKNQLKTDLDQAHFAIGCCVGGKLFKDKPADLESWTIDNYKTLQPSVGPLLKYLETNHFGSDYKQAIGIAYRTLERTLQRIKETDGEFKKASEQMSLFGN